MKKYLRLLVSSQILIVLLLIPESKVSAQVGVNVSFQTFYDDLSPYGTWVDDPQYGNVWVPNERKGFRPYQTDGHWVMTDYGNTWVSDDPWGWAPYHYGRWTYDPYYGWLWVPGYEWAPAWVSWRYSDQYCGWAPLSPGISIGVNYNCPNDWWVFVGPQYLYRPDYYHYWRGSRYNASIIGRTRFENNPYVDNSTHVRYNSGPRPQEIERVTHQAVPTYKLAHASQRGRSVIQGNSVAMYRPAVKQTPNAHPEPAHTMRAPQPIGRPQPANANKQAPFHAAMQQRQTQQNNPVKPGTNRQQPISQPPNRQQQPQSRPQQPQNRPQQQQPNRQQQQPQNRPQQQQPNRPQQQQPQNRPQQQQPNRQQQQPQNRPQQQPQNRPQQEQPNRQQQPQNRPQQQQPMSQPQQQRQAPPQQHQAPRNEAPQEHERR